MNICENCHCKRLYHKSIKHYTLILRTLYIFCILGIQQTASKLKWGNINKWKTGPDTWFLICFCHRMIFHRWKNNKQWTNHEKQSIKHSTFDAHRKLITDNIINVVQCSRSWIGMYCIAYILWWKMFNEKIREKNLRKFSSEFFTRHKLIALSETYFVLIGWRNWRFGSKNMCLHCRWDDESNQKPLSSVNENCPVENTFFFSTAFSLLEHSEWNEGSEKSGRLKENWKTEHKQNYKLENILCDYALANVVTSLVNIQLNL